MVAKGSFAICLLLLAACATAPPQPTMARPVWKAPEPIEIGSATDIDRVLPKCRPARGRDCTNPAYLPALRDPLSIPQATQTLAGMSHRSYSSSHGTQVTYFAPDGRVFLWYPGNSRVLAGQWKVALYQDLIGATPEIAVQMRAYHAQMPLAAVERFDGNYVCFRYGDSFNPAMWPGPANRWDCAEATEYVRLGTAELVPGDLFGLADRTAVPYVIPRSDRQNLDFATLRRLAGSSGSM